MGVTCGTQPRCGRQCTQHDNLWLVRPGPVASRRVCRRLHTLKQQTGMSPAQTRCPAASSTDMEATTISQPAAPARTAPTADYKLVTSPADLMQMLEDLRSVTCLAVDCEGVKLGEREGSQLTLLQLSAKTSANGKGPLRIWIVDVLALQWRTFQYHTADGTLSLKKILEDDNVTKLIFDVRSDAFQLQTEYGVRLRSAYDLQLAEVAVRQLQMLTTAYVLPLDKALAGYISPRTAALEEDLLAGYEIARAYHWSNKTEVWAERPLAPELLKYAASDVRYLHQLADALNMKLPNTIIDKVRQVSITRAVSTAAPNRQRAGAPTIVTRGDVLRLINSKQQQPSTPAHAADTTPNGSHAATSGGTGDHAEGGATSTHSAHTNTVGPTPAQQQQHRRTRRKGGSAPTTTTAASPVPAPVKRELPPLLGRAPSSGSEPGIPVSQSEVKSATHSGSFLLQPRQRAEDEVAPTWIYDSLTPKPAAGQPADSHPDTDTTAAVAQSGQGAFEETPGSSSSNDSAAVPEAAQGRDESAAPEDTDQSEVEAGLLLWSPGQARAAAGQGLQRPTLQRPNHRVNT